MGSPSSREQEVEVGGARRGSSPPPQITLTSILSQDGRGGKRGGTPIPVSSTGQALTFAHQGGREKSKMDSRFRGENGLKRGKGEEGRKTARPCQILRRGASSERHVGLG